MGFMTVREAAAFLSVERKMVYKLIEEDKLPAYRLSERIIRINEEDLVAWVKNIKSKLKLHFSFS